MATKKATKKATEPIAVEKQAATVGIVPALAKRNITAKVWENETDPGTSYVKLESPTNSRLITLANEELKAKDIVDRLERMVGTPEPVK